MSAGPLLKECHRLRRHAMELQERIETAPRQLKAQQNKLATAEESLKKAQDTLKQLKVDLSQKELSIKTTLSQIAKWEKQLNAATAPKEYDALRSEISQGKASITKLEEESLNLLQEVEDRSSGLPGVEQTTKKSRDDFSQWQKDQEERLARYATEKSKAMEELAKIEGSMSGDLKPQYDRLIAAKGVEALAGAKKGTCQTCYTDVTPQKRTELVRGLLVMCSCGRMLYQDD